MKLQKTYSWLRGIASLLLFFAYFLNVASFESFHQAIHQHEHAELHTVEAEADACHRAIYHGDVASDCEHKSHITNTETDCELCKVTVSRFFYSSPNTNVLPEQVQVIFTNTAWIKIFESDLSLIFAPRGPPLFS